jgi:hypothetical protein
VIRTDDAREMETLMRGTRSAAATTLGEELDEAARAPHRAAAKLALSDSEPRSVVDLAREILALSGDLAIAPLLESEVPSKSRLFAIRLVGNAALSLRDRVSLWVEGSLIDKEEIPKDPAPDEEEAPRPERVCDVAAVELRRLHHIAEDPIPAALAARDLTGISFSDRDTVIEKRKAAKDWRLDVSLDEGEG